MTLHGGSGTNDADLQEAIRSGMNIIHVNTELRVAWRKALEKSLARDEAEIVPYKILAEPFRAVQGVVRQRLQCLIQQPHKLIPHSRRMANNRDGTLA